MSTLAPPPTDAASNSPADVKAAVFDFWEKSDAYRDFGPEHLAETPHRRRMRDLLADCGSVLDIACGDGNNLPHMPAGVKYTGVDCSPVGVARLIAREDHADLTKTAEVGDVEHLSFDDETFEAVISTFAFEHFLDVPQILRECDRVLKPGGRIVLIGPDFEFPNNFGPPQRDQLLGRRCPLIAYAAARWCRRVWNHLRGACVFEYVTPLELNDNTYVPDADMTHLTNHREIARYMEPFGYRVVAHESGDPAPTGVKRWTQSLGLWGHNGDAMLCLQKVGEKSREHRVVSKTL